MNRQTINFKKSLALLAISITSFGLQHTAMADEQQNQENIVMEQVGHLNFAKDGKSHRKVASATTIISKIYRNKAEVSVSQSFANDSEQTITGEYFFPLPYNSHLVDFTMDTDYLAQGELPDTTVTLEQTDQLKVRFAYQLVDDSPYHASVMGFPAKQNLLLQEKGDNKELIAKK